jgi:hypothetical protein
VSGGSLGNVTQSCPILAESEGLHLTTSTTTKPYPLVTCSISTQTDIAAVVMNGSSQSRRSSSSGDGGPIRSLLDAIDDDGDGDGNYLDKLSDDIR